MRYYYFLCAVPELSIRLTPDMTFQELKDLLELNLASADRPLLEALLRPIDFYNIRALWIGAPLDERGNMSSKELEEALLVPDGFPEYLDEFLSRYEDRKSRLKAFSFLLASLYREESKAQVGFLGTYYQFLREHSLILTALRAKAFGRDLGKELQFEDPFDPLISYILAQKDAPDFIPPLEFEPLKTLFVENVHSPDKLNRSILEYRLKKIEEMEEEQQPFSLDCVLSYIARFLIVDSLRRIDSDKGKLEVEKLSEYE